MKTKSTHRLMLLALCALGITALRAQQAPKPPAAAPAPTPETRQPEAPPRREIPREPSRENPRANPEREREHPQPQRGESAPQPPRNTDRQQGQQGQRTPREGSPRREEDRSFRGSPDHRQGPPPMRHRDHDRRRSPQPQGRMEDRRDDRIPSPQHFRSPRGPEGERHDFSPSQRGSEQRRPENFRGPAPRDGDFRRDDHGPRNDFRRHDHSPRDDRRGPPPPMMHRDGERDQGPRGLQDRDEPRRGPETRFQPRGDHNDRRPRGPEPRGA